MRNKKVSQQLFVIDSLLIFSHFQLTPISWSASQYFDCNTTLHSLIIFTRVYAKSDVIGLNFYAWFCFGIVGFFLSLSNHRFYKHHTNTHSSDELNEMCEYKQFPLQIICFGSEQTKYLIRPLFIFVSVDGVPVAAFYWWSTLCLGYSTLDVTFSYELRPKEELSIKGNSVLSADW